MKLHVTVIPETVITEQEQAVPWILLLLVLLDIGAGGMAIRRAVKMARSFTGMRY
jgi:F0F1-type ATP synthase assembly protein I